MKVSELNEAFAIENENGRLWFEQGPGDIPRLKIESPVAKAEISLQGAHLLSWVPKGHGEQIWVSRDATFAEGKSVRGGIPVCWPWFGAHKSEPGFTPHGFARMVYWQLESAELLEGGEARLCFSLDTTRLGEREQQIWPVATRADYCLQIGEQLSLSLTTTNRGDEAFVLGQALHTYFLVGDVTQSKVLGLAGKEYLDKTDGFKRKTQQGDVIIESEVDRVYLDSDEALVIDNGRQQVTINKSGSHTTIVWNPWQQLAEKMGDLGPGGYRQMLCVESGNAADDVVTLKPGEAHTLLVTYSVTQ